MNLLRRHMIAVAALGLSFSPVAWAADQQHELPLNYNLNALYQGPADVGFQSISDRALIYDGSVVPNGTSPPVVSNHGVQAFTSTTTGLSYRFVNTPATLDT